MRTLPAKLLFKKKQHQKHLLKSPFLEKSGTKNISLKDRKMGESGTKKIKSNVLKQSYI
jgi:hypothetical protein